MTINSINKNQEALNTPLNENTEEYYKLKYNKKLILYYISNKFYENQIVERREQMLGTLEAIDVTGEKLTKENIDLIWYIYFLIFIFHSQSIIY